MSEFSPAPQPKQSGPRSWWLLLTLPLIGVAGAIIILISADDSNGGQSTTQNSGFPTPKPVTFIPPTKLPTPVPSPQMSILGDVVPDVTLATLDETTPVKLLDEKTNILFLNFWATWCEPCVAEMPILQDLAVNHAQDGVRVIAVTDPAGGQTLADIEAFVVEHELTLIIALSSDADFYDQFGVLQIPITFVIDRTGVVQHRHIGPLTAEDIDWYLDAMAS